MKILINILFIYLSLLFIVGNNNVGSIFSNLIHKHSVALKCTKDFSNDAEDDDECDCEKEIYEAKIKDIICFNLPNNIYYHNYQKEKYYLTDIKIDDSKYTSIVLPPPNI